MSQSLTRRPGLGRRRSRKGAFVGVDGSCFRSTLSSFNERICEVCVEAALRFYGFIALTKGNEMARSESIFARIYREYQRLSVATLEERTSASRSASTRGKAPSRPRSLRFEPLESRELLSLTHPSLADAVPTPPRKSPRSSSRPSFRRRKPFPFRLRRRKPPNRRPPTRPRATRAI